MSLTKEEQAALEQTHNIKITCVISFTACTECGKRRYRATANTSGKIIHVCEDGHIQNGQAPKITVAVIDLQKIPGYEKSKPLDVLRYKGGNRGF
ncbi:hypothetical protein KKA15_06320 [Patescibacteria group bacterium]|nr:hypothetical protein [Patescibacteria group bacterium]